MLKLLAKIVIGAAFSLVFGLFLAMPMAMLEVPVLGEVLGTSSDMPGVHRLLLTLAMGALLTCAAGYLMHADEKS